MTCDKCNSERVADINGKVSDLCFVSLLGKNKDGYAPSDMNVGGGDYLDFGLCLNCGKVQGEFPVAKTELESANEDLDTKEEKDYTLYNEIVGQWRHDPDDPDQDHDVFRRIFGLAFPGSAALHGRKELEFGADGYFMLQKMTPNYLRAQGKWSIEDSDILFIETSKGIDFGYESLRYKIISADEEKLVLAKL